MDNPDWVKKRELPSVSMDIINYIPIGEFLKHYSHFKEGMAHPERFELPTLGLEDRCSIR